MPPPLPPHSPKLGEALAAEGKPEVLQFVLGTEAGMVTSIVRRVQAMIRKVGRGARERIGVVRWDLRWQGAAGWPWEGTS